MLYRKYRPQTFAQVIGQEHVVKTLQGGFITGRVGHAFLFAGPRGTGKTTIARVFAKALNCAKRGKDGDPCNKCPACLSLNEGRSLDLVEIDAASNRGIDEIRNIKESAGVASLGGGYKVFLIDEVHMLTKDAFNALLKILEEPPEHVVFILATTEPHKILPTVLSRVQRFDFKKLTHAQILAKLKSIATAEKISISEDALMALAMSSDGAFRDAEVAFTKVLTTVAFGTKIDERTVQDILGLIPMHCYPELLGLLAARDQSGALKLLQGVFYGGVDPDHFTKEFLEYLRKVLLTRVNPAILAAVGQELIGEHAKTLSAYAQQLDPDAVIRMIAVFTRARLELKNASIAQLPLELAIMELTAR